jgi:phenylalanyl-tRNA synthetase beta chain
VLAEIEAAVPEQPRHIAAVLVGNIDASGWWGHGRAADWSDAFGLVELIADRAGLTIIPNGKVPGPTWHPGRSSELVITTPTGEELVGVAGELHPQVCVNFGLPPRSVAVELNLSALTPNETDVVQAVPVSVYPAAKEDFAFVVAADFPAGELRDVIQTAAAELVEDVTLFDVYSGAQLGADQKSLAYKVRLRASDQTLTDEQVKGARESILNAAAKVGATLRS